MPKYKKNNKYLNKAMLNRPKDNDFNYRYNDNRSIIDLRTEPNTSYYLNTPKITSKSFINSPLLSKSIHPRKNSLFSLYTDNTVNPTYDIIYNLQNTLQLTERIKNKYLNKNKSFNYKKHIPKKRKVSNKENIINNKGNIDTTNEFKTSIKSSKNKKKYENENEDGSDIIVPNEYIDNGKRNKELNIKRKELILLNIELRKENKILEKEINNYKKQFYNYRNYYNKKNFNNIPGKDFDYFKNKFKSSINDNNIILDKIIEIHENNENLEENVYNLYEKNKNIFKKIENKNRQNA